MFRLKTDLMSCVLVACEVPHCYGVQHRLRAEQQQCTVAERAASQHAAVSAARPPRAPGTNQKCSEAPPGVARERGSGAAEAVTGAAAHRRREGEYCTSRPQHGGGEGHACARRLCMVCAFVLVDARALCLCVPQACVGRD